VLAFCVVWQLPVLLLSLHLNVPAEQGFSFTPRMLTGEQIYEQINNKNIKYTYKQ
jgi:hypothetical protein